MSLLARDTGPSAALTARELAVLAEGIDAKNWLDDFAAAPHAIRQGLALNHRTENDLAMVSSAIPFSHFNMVLTLGCPAPVNEDAFATIDRFYAEAPAGKHWIMANDQSEPRDLVEQLTQRGYGETGSWDRIVLRGVREDLWRSHAAGCEIVGNHNAEEWSSFILKVYGMPRPIAHWLQALVGRPGWIHALRRQNGRSDGPVVMARSLFHAGGWAWLGIDAPVPGVMAPCFDDDRAVIATLLCGAAEASAHSFVSDVEAATPSRRGLQYQYWYDLGFKVVYSRRLFSKANT